MIIVDYSAIAMSSIYSLNQSNNFDENFIRHIILNSLRMYNVKFRKDYGEMVIACDGPGTWRKKVYKEYKAARKTHREKQSSFDWESFFSIINNVREEIENHLPWKVIHLSGAEADDIIATLAFRTQEFGQHENVMIVSSDKDFIQLQKFSNVKQFSPNTKKLVKDKNPAQYLREHIFRGDAGDGIPNILSPDNTFVDSIRQKPVTKKKLEEWTANIDNLKSFLSDDEYKNYLRNEELIDLTKIPESLIAQINTLYESAKTKNNIFNYFIKKRCRNLIECIEEFTTPKQ